VFCSSCPLVCVYTCIHDFCLPTKHIYNFSVMFPCLEVAKAALFMAWCSFFCLLLVCSVSQESKWVQACWLATSFIAYIGPVLSTHGLLCLLPTSYWFLACPTLWPWR
jgi:hypothetical protein